jgi:hypothetical protein
MQKRTFYQLPAFCLLLLSFSQISFADQSALLTLLKCKSALCRRAALNDINNDKVRYSREVAQSIENAYKQDGTNKELFTLLYVAALIKSQESLPIIQKIWLDENRFEDDCIYCCPRSLVLTVFGIHGLWKPPSLSAKQRQHAAVADTLSEIDRFKHYSPNSEHPEKPNVEGDDEWSREAKRILSLNDNQLLEIATNSTASYRQRYSASEELRRRIADDTHLVDYYWWALNACEDDSGECLCFAHECILRAEFYNAQKKQ